MTTAAIETEAQWLGDTRAAEAIVRENDELHGLEAIVKRAEQATGEKSQAA